MRVRILNLQYIPSKVPTCVIQSFVNNNLLWMIILAHAVKIHEYVRIDFARAMMSMAITDFRKFRSIWRANFWILMKFV